MDEITVNEITDIEALGNICNENNDDEYAEDDSDYEEMEYIEGDDWF